MLCLLSLPKARRRPSTPRVGRPCRPPTSAPGMNGSKQAGTGGYGGIPNRLRCVRIGATCSRGRRLSCPLAAPNWLARTCFQTSSLVIQRVTDRRVGRRVAGLEMLNKNNAGRVFRTQGGRNALFGNSARADSGTRFGYTHSNPLCPTAMVTRIETVEVADFTIKSYDAWFRRLIGAASMFRISILALIFGFTSIAVFAEDARQLKCSGTMIEPSAMSRSPETVILTLGPAQKLTLDLGQGAVNARKVSDNKIQLKFRTKDFEGEYFHYTGDLFLIYKSGHLMKLMCLKRES
jgi:hypothetical protein